MSLSLPDNLYSSEQTRFLERHVIQNHGIAGTVLMKRAGRAAFEHACQAWSDNRAWLVVCGGGNNAGDGYVFAALAAQRQHRVEVRYLTSPDQLQNEAKAAADYARQEGVVMQPFNEAEILTDNVVIVDGLVGTGLCANVRDHLETAIRWIHQTCMPVLALDVPSGLSADTGAELGLAVSATQTISFITLKPGLLTGRGPALAGLVTVADLNVPLEAFDLIAPVAERIDLGATLHLLPQREADAHKGHFGHVMVIGGEYGYGGAAILAAESAAFAGSGLVSLATRGEHVSAALVRRPEIMALGVPSGQELEPYLERPTVLVVGPGLARTPWSEQMLQQALQANRPLVLDADALNILAEGRLPLPDHGHWVMTPHPGEAARLLGCSTEEVQADRVSAVRRLQEKFGGVIVLKGAGTLIDDGQSCFLANVGNAGLATGGSGDVLSGVIASLIAQGLSLLDAACLGVCLHGEAAEMAVEDTGIAGLQAAELILYVRELMKL